MGWFVAEIIGIVGGLGALIVAYDGIKFRVCHHAIA
jgi:hypothetical protein